MSSQNQINSTFFFIGHFSIDIIVRSRTAHKKSLGGSVSYCSLALRTYAPDVNIDIISHIGKLNFQYSLLDIIKNRNINLNGVVYSEVENTKFTLDYFDHTRTLILESRSPSLNFEDIPSDYLNNPPDSIVLVPLCGEISYEYVSKVLDSFPDVCIGIDLQGFVRKIDQDCKVCYLYDDDIISNIIQIIQLIGDRLILKGSEEEMKLLANESSDLKKVMVHFNSYNTNAIFIMTLGEKGSMILKNGKEILKIPAFKPKKVIDETGAGDTYFSIFLYEFIRSDKSWDSVKSAAYFASAAASFSIEKKGPAGFETKTKVIKRVNRENYIN